MIHEEDLTEEQNRFIDALEEETFQVNVTYTVDDDVKPSITRWSPDGYVGRLVDTQYMDGCDETNWCVFSGTYTECQQYIAEHYGDKEAQSSLDPQKGLK